MEEISFADAQRRVCAVVEGPWEVNEQGEFYLAPYGAENATHWNVIYDSRESLVDHDPMYLWMDKPITLVSKTTGEITEINYLANWDLVNAMTEVGDWPPGSSP
jgi:hypothetical protein